MHGAVIPLRMPSSKFVVGLITLVTSYVPLDVPEPDTGTKSVDSIALIRTVTVECRQGHFTSGHTPV